MYFPFKFTDKDVIPDPLTLTGLIPEQTGISQWPPKMYFDIAEYLNPNSQSFGDLIRCLMTDYKDGKLYSYFDSKFHNISYIIRFFLCLVVSQIYCIEHTITRGRMHLK